MQHQQLPAVSATEYVATSICCNASNNICFFFFVYFQNIKHQFLNVIVVVVAGFFNINLMMHLINNTSIRITTKTTLRIIISFVLFQLFSFLFSFLFSSRLYCFFQVSCIQISFTRPSIAIAHKDHQNLRLSKYKEFS